MVIKITKTLKIGFTWWPVRYLRTWKNWFACRVCLDNGNHKIHQVTFLGFTAGFLITQNQQ